MISRDTIVYRTILSIARQNPDYDELRSHAMLKFLATADTTRATIRTRLQELNLTEFQFASLVVLYALDPEPIIPTTLADYASASRATITEIVDRLLERALISRSRSKDDRRNYFITLTETGRSLAARAETLFLRTITELSEPLTEPAPRALLAICDKLGQRNR